MTQKEHDERVDELRISLVETEMQIKDIRKQLDELDKAKIEPESRRYNPKIDAWYYSINDNGDVVTHSWYRTSKDIYRYAIGNCFKTREEAEFEVERLRVIAKLKEFAEPEDRVWSEDSNWAIVYSNEKHEVRAENWCSIQNATLYFESRERVHEAVEAIGEDRIKKYYLRVKG